LQQSHPTIIGAEISIASAPKETMIVMKRPTWLWIFPALFCALVCADEYKTGSQSVTLKVGELERNFLLHVPPQYDGTKPLPLVMFFHGGMGTAKHAEEHYGWSEKADKEGFFVVYGNGTGQFPTWNCVHGCGSAFRGQVDDVGYVKAVLQDLNAKLKLDPKRIYATGMSNGAMFTHRLAAEMSDVLAAGAPVAGTIGGKENESAQEKRIPQPKNPVAMVIIHGKEDKNVRYDGGVTKAGVERGRVDLSVADSVAFWVKANGCEAAPKKEELKANVAKESYSSPSGADVVLYTILDGTHAWPGGKAMFRRATTELKSISATDVAWEFFAAHPKK
jgi:polyhydroxybutyrate depolymerase